jgi:hypothetical protein
MHYISNWIPTHAIGKWLFGAAMLPIELTLREVFLRIGKSTHICQETMVEYYKRNFQKVDAPANRFYYLHQSSKIKRFIAEKIVNLIQASNVAAIEETLVRIGFQYCVLTWIPSCFNEQDDSQFEEKPIVYVALRIATTAIVFGLLHCRSAEVRNARREHSLSLEAIKKERNFQVISTIASGIIYSSAYELAGQSFWAAHGAHTMWNFAHDVIVLNSWQKEPMQKRKKRIAESTF